MGAYFRGWKRKVGVVAVVLACSLTAGWIRSQRTTDTITWNGRITLSSIDGRLCFSKSKSTVKSYVPSWYTDINHGLEWRYDDEEIWEKSIWGGPGIVIGVGLLQGVERIFFPYSFVVIPLTFISACLLLSKPRRPKRSVEYKR